MRSRERLLTSLACQEPDRVPFLESVVEESVAVQLLGKEEADPVSPEHWLKSDTLRIGLRPPSGASYYAIELVNNLSLDAIGISFYLPNFSIKREVDGRSMVIGGAIDSRADADKITLPDPDAPQLYEPLRKFVSTYESTGLARFCRIPLGADPVILGLGFERFALALYDDCALIEQLFDLYSTWYARAMQHICALGFDFIWSGEDIAHKSGPYLSPKMFRNIFMPYYRRVAEQITKPWIFHSDGDLTLILDDLVSLGINGLHPIEPGPMDLGMLKKRYAGRLCLCGHISLDRLSRGTPQEIEQLVSQAIAIAGPGGGYIAGSSNSITEYCQPENVRAMQHAIHRYGRYPLH